MTHDGDRSIRFDGKIEIPQDGLSTRWVAEPQILEFYATMCDCFNTFLFRIDPGWFLDDSEYKLGSFTCLAN